MTDTPSLGERLRQLRLLYGKRLGRRVTQAEVADEVGIARSTLTAYEKSHDKPGRDTLAALANFYDVSLDYLAGVPEAVLLNSEDVAHDEEERTLLRVWRRVSEEERLSLMVLLRARILADSDAA